jgi:tetratricopeptide (TPR) repeat protein
MHFNRNLKRIIIVCICHLACHDLIASQVKEKMIPEDNVANLKKEPQILDDSNLDIIFNRYIEAIEKKEGDEGPYNRDIPEMLYSLGKKLQSNNRYEEAINVYRKAVYISRINDGLYGLSQDTTLRAIIESQKIQGKIKEVAASYSQLLQIYKKSYKENNPNFLIMIDEFSRWSLRSYLQTGGQDDAYHLETAFDLYTDTIRILSEQYGELHPSLLPSLNKLATTCYYLSVHQRRFPDYGETDTSVPFGYRSMAPVNQIVGRGAFFKHGHIAQDQILKILDENSNFTPIEIAKGQTNLGDWYLLFGKYQLAMSAYKKSYEIVVNDQKNTKILDEIYSQPVMLPSNEFFGTEKTKGLASNKSEKNSNLSYMTSYVNLLVDITDGGNPINLNVKKIFPSEMNSFGSRAIETVRTKKFRPKLINRSPVLTTQFPMRVIIPNE